MSFNDLAAEAVANGDIGVGFLISDACEVFWQVGTWEGFNVCEVLAEWKKSAMTPITVGGLKFTIIGKTPERLVSTNIGGQGHLVAAKCSFYPGYLICWCPATVGPNIAYAVIQKLADMVKA